MYRVGDMPTPATYVVAAPMVRGTIEYRLPMVLEDGIPACLLRTLQGTGFVSQRLICGRVF